MNVDSSLDNIDNPCYTDFALQEYLQGRLSDPVRLALKGHVQECTACGSVYSDIEREQAYFQYLGTIRGEKSATDCIDSLVLAAYLDGGDEAVERERVESHLLNCEKCAGLIVSIYRGIQEVDADLEANPGSGVTLLHDGSESVILTMPKRPIPDRTRRLPLFPLRHTGTHE